MTYQPRHSAPSRRLQRSRRVAGATATAAATVFATTALAGTAYALWTAGGIGSVNASAATAQDLTASPVTVPSSLLYPGATTDAKITINNPNPYPVTVVSIAGGTVTSDKGPACNASTGVSFANQSGAFAVPAGASQTFTLTNAVTMSNASDSSCQGAVFTLPVTLSGASS